MPILIDNPQDVQGTQAGAKCSYSNLLHKSTRQNPAIKSPANYTHYKPNAGSMLISINKIHLLISLCLHASDSDLPRRCDKDPEQF